MSEIPDAERLHNRALRQTQIISDDWVDHAIAIWQRRTTEGHTRVDILRYVLSGLLCQITGESSAPADMADPASWQEVFRRRIADERAQIVADLRALGMDYYGQTSDFIDRHPGLHDGVTVAAVVLAVADEIEGAANA